MATFLSHLSKPRQSVSAWSIFSEAVQCFKAEKMAQLLKCLSFKHEDLCSVLVHIKKVGLIWQATCYNFSVVEVAAGGFLWLVALIV